MTSVYETTFAFQAQMICDLLVSAGVPARVDGSYLRGISGEVPLGNAVRVRVPPEREAEARAIIAEWESAPVPSDEAAAAEAEAAGLGAGKPSADS
jgi:putative signal transducing protein